MNETQNKTNWAVLAGLRFLLSLTASFAYHRAYLSQGFFTDDYNFLKLCKAESPVDCFGYLSPFFGWLYRPVYLLYFTAIYTFTSNPAVFHGGSLVLHAAVLTLAATLVYRLSRSWLAAIIAALVFLWWPTKSEAIWWISSASTLLATLFYLATLHLWLSYRTGNRCRHFVGAICCMALALCSKNDAASLPLTMLMVDGMLQVPYRGQWKRWSVEVATVGVLFVLYLAAEWAAAKVYTAAGDPHSANFYAITLAGRLRAIPKMWQYMFLPFGMLTPRTLIMQLPVLVVSVGAVAATVWASRTDRALRSLLLCAAWAVVATLPVPLAAGEHALSPRFSYLSAQCYGQNRHSERPRQQLFLPEPQRQNDGRNQ